MKKLYPLLFFPWTVWCLFIFFLLAFLSFPFLFIGVSLFGKSKPTMLAMHRFPEAVARAVVFLWGIRVEQVGLSNIPKNQQCMFSSNHRSYLDALVVGSYIPNWKKYLGKAEILSYPVLGFLLKKLYVPVKREDKDNRKWSMEKMKEKMGSGASMVILPEGTCNQTDHLLKPFHDGAFRLAIYLQIPLCIGTLINTGELFPRSLKYIRPGKVKIYWDPPIATKGLKEDDIPGLKEQVASMMLRHLEKHYPQGYHDAPKNRNKKIQTVW